MGVMNDFSAKANGIGVKATTAPATSLVLSTVACKFLDAYCIGASSGAGYLLVYDATTAPADGAGQTPFAVVPIAAGATGGVNLTYPYPCQNGCVIVFSSTGPYTQTTSSLNAQFISGQAGGF